MWIFHSSPPFAAPELGQERCASCLGQQTCMSEILLTSGSIFCLCNLPSPWKQLVDVDSCEQSFYLFVKQRQELDLSQFSPMLSPQVSLPKNCDSYTKPVPPHMLLLIITHHNPFSETTFFTGVKSSTYADCSLAIVNVLFQAGFVACRQLKDSPTLISITP